MREHIQTQYFIYDDNNEHCIENLNVYKDLAVIFDSKLSFREHKEKIEKAYKMLGIIKRNFIHFSSDTFIQLYKSIVRPHLDYANSVWHPYKVGDIDDIEKFQKGQPSWSSELISLKKLPYKDRLEHLHLVTLKYRRLRGDTIEVYRIVTNNKT